MIRVCPHSRTSAMAAAVGVCLMSAAAPAAVAQGNWGWSRGGSHYAEIPERDIFPSDQFTFCRIRYTSYHEHPQYNLRGGRWSIDYPESDEHFSWRLSELTTIKVARTEEGGYRHDVVRLTDDDLYNYPFIYMVEVGELVFSEEEVAILRDYLLRGGFLMVDDFWGNDEWMNWKIQFSRVFDPNEYPMVELDITHPIFNCVFELQEKPQVPNPYHWMSTGGDTSERGEESRIVHYKGVYDKKGRLMVVMCHNTDLGDGWEREGENRDYFREMSAKRAYPMGINIVVYAMTH